jgi:hypothetical protein
MERAMSEHKYNPLTAAARALISGAAHLQLRDPAATEVHPQARELLNAACRALEEEDKIARPHVTDAKEAIAYCVDEMFAGTCANRRGA